jgi:histidine ammonia-lyase
MDRIPIDGNNLTLEHIWEVSVNSKEVYLPEETKEKVEFCRKYVEKLVSEKKVVYGLTTGFGKFSSINIPIDKLEELQENLILSHATGVGKNFSVPETRAIMLLRANVLAKGNSGIKLETLQTLIEMLNSQVHPCIPEKGSVGASGDLAPLSHLALVLIGYGKAEYKGKLMEGPEAMKLAGIKPVKLAAKEGLALNNGTQVMTGVSALTLAKALHLCKIADICAAASVDALLGTPAAYDELVHQLRPHTGQLKSAANMRNLLENSQLRKSHLYCANVQDPYSLRCVPQVHGAVRNALDYVKTTIDTEINCATDNPLIFPKEERVISGGNFHGEPVAFASDVLAFTVSELANIAERRIEQLCNPALNRELKAFLAPRPGLDSGFMIAHVTAASLVSENKTMSHPASVDSISTSANQEDHVSMGTIGAVKAREIINNVAYVLGIELMIAVQALDERNIQSSDSLEAVRHLVRKYVPYLDKDRNMNDDILQMHELMFSSELLETVGKFIDME